MFTMFLTVLFYSPVVVSSFAVISDLYFFLSFISFLSSASESLVLSVVSPLSFLVLVCTSVSFWKSLWSTWSQLPTALWQLVCLYSPAPFLLLDFRFFACRPQLVPFGSLFFEWGELFWIIRRFVWVNAMLQANKNCLPFSPARRLGTTRLFPGWRLSFSTSERLLPAYMSCPFLRTKLDQGHTHFYFPLLSWQEWPGGVRREGKRRRRRRKMGGECTQLCWELSVGRNSSQKK